MITIAYHSAATIEFSPKDLAELLSRAREENARLKVTGVLLYRNGRFMQILEGPKTAVRRVFGTILTDSRHRDVQVISDDPIPRRRFPIWTMGYQSLADENYRQGAGAYNPADLHRVDPGLKLALARAKLLYDWLQDDWLTSMRMPSMPSHVIETISAAKQPSQLTAAPEQVATAPSNTGTSVVVTAIFDQIMADMRNGSLLPGDRVSDAEVAARLGLSRTPVREAMQKLRSIGVVEVSASRFTRIAEVEPAQAANHLTVLVALFSAVLDEVIGSVSETTLDQMRADRDEFAARRLSGNPAQIIASAIDFFMRLVAESRNAHLQQAIGSAIHPVQLASGHLDAMIGLDTIAQAMDEMLAAAVAGDLTRAKAAAATMWG